MGTQDGYPQQVLDWYFESARPVVQRYVPHRLAALDDAGVQLKKLVEKASSRTTIGLLGHSNIGKTSLLNAILVGKGALLPADGLGPCTAQATHISYSEQPQLHAFYRSAAWVESLVRELEEGLERQGGDEALAALEVEGGAGLETTGALARLLVTGDPLDPAPAPYLAACLRSALGRGPGIANAPAPRDRDRVRRIRAALESGRLDCTFTSGRSRFRAELALHAAGSLAPLTSRLELGWKSSVLRDGLCLVDLPGVGIAADPYQEVAQEWVRAAPQAIALVVDSAGVSRDAFELLRSSGIFTRILESASDPSADPVALLVVVTKADLAADAAWARDHSRPWHEHLVEVRERLVERKRLEVGSLISQALGGASARSQETIARIKARLRVEAVSSTEFAKLIANDPANRARIEDRAQSGLPAFVRSMREVVKGYEERRSLQTLAASRQLDQRLRATLYVTRERASENPSPPIDAKRVRAAIDRRTRTSRARLEGVRSAYRRYLTQELPRQFEQLVEEARKHGDRALLGDYMEWLDQLVFPRLLATLRRGGRWNGVHIARDLAERLVEPICAAWKQTILFELRSRSLALAAEGIKAARELSDSLQREGLVTRRELAEGLLAQIEAEAQSLSELGAANAKVLRIQLRDRLVALLETRVRVECERVAASASGGPGAKLRLLRQTERIIKRWLEDAQPVLRAVLVDVRQSLAEEARRSLERLGDPVSQMSDALLLVETEPDGRRPSRHQARAAAAALGKAPEAP